MKKYSILITLLLVCFACSKTEHDPTGRGDELTLNANVNTTVQGGKISRAGTTTAFTKDFDLFLTQTAPTVHIAGPVRCDAKYATSKYNVYNGTSIMYWDDFGGTDAALSLLGIYPKNKITDINSNSLAWSVALDQNLKDGTDHFDQSDLLISEQLAYSLSLQKSNAHLTFEHVLSKVTIVLIPGEGFNGQFGDTESTRPKAKLIDFNTKCDIDIENRTLLSNDGTPDAITLRYNSTDVDNKQTFEAIVVPGQTFGKDIEFGQIEIAINGSTNTYSLKMPNEIDIEQGKNYLFEVTVNKSSTDVEASVVDWDEVKSIGNEAKINLENVTSIGNATITENSELLIDVNGNKGHYKATKEDESSPIKWESINKIYWDNIQTSSTLKANAVLCLGNSIDNINDNPEHIYVGESQVLDKAYNYIQFKEMTHPFSKINLTIKSKKTGEERVELDKISQILSNGLYKFNNVNTTTADADFLKIIYEDNNATFNWSYPESDKDGIDNSYFYYYVAPLYIKPGKSFAKGEKLLEITVNEALGIQNIYPFYIPVEEGITFEANKEYNITITLKKTEIVDVEVSIQGWVKTGDINGGATIDK